jgi:hypothetical protein
MARLFVAFVLLLYVPTLVFRFLANVNIDLTSRKFANQIEDFFAAAAPSLLLNIITAVLINTITVWFFLDVTASLPQLLMSDWTLFLRQHLWWCFWYYILLMATATISGYIYGWADLQLSKWALEGPDDVVGTPPGVPRELWRWARAIHTVWHVFFELEKVPLFSLMAQSTYVFVKTSDGRIIHGLFDRYDNTADGQITAIRLSEVARIQDWKAAVAGTEKYVVPLSGTLLMKWDEVADINVADLYEPNTLNRLQADLEEAKRKKTEEGVNPIVRMIRFFRRK